MKASQLNKYVWLLDLIYTKRRISLKEINRYWIENEISNGEEIPERTFHKWRIAIENLFGLIIENEKRGDYRYYILNDEEIVSGGLRRWLLNTFSISNLLINSQSLKNRILLEDIPSGQQFLFIVMEAMKESKILQITYQSYWHKEEKTFEVAPYCLKLFKQRWYMVAHSSQKNKILVFSLDRVLEMSRIENKTFILPNDFSPEAFFQDSYGVIVGDGTKVERVELQVSCNQAKYIRSLPLHQSQSEIYAGDDFSIFEYVLRPTFDFQQEILSRTPEIEVLKPLWLRYEIAWKVEAMSRKYNG